MAVCFCVRSKPMRPRPKSANMQCVSISISKRSRAWNARVARAARKSPKGGRRRKPIRDHSVTRVNATNARPGAAAGTRRAELELRSATIPSGHVKPCALWTVSAQASRNGTWRRSSRGNFFPRRVTGGTGTHVGWSGQNGSPLKAGKSTTTYRGRHGGGRPSSNTTAITVPRAPFMSPFWTVLTSQSWLDVSMTRAPIAKCTLVRSCRNSSGGSFIARASLCSASLPTTGAAVLLVTASATKS